MDSGLSVAMKEMDKVYLADGHHRLASSLKLMHRYANEPGVDRILAYLIPAEELNILGFHREVLNWSGDLKKILTQISSLESVSKINKIEEFNDEPQHGEIDLMFNGEVHRIVLTRDKTRERIDAQWLGEEVIEKFLGINDPRNNPNLKYIPGTESREDLANRKGNLVFYLHPIPVKQIMNTADAGGHLPPKSTWVEPKLRSGLFVYEFGNHDHPEYNLMVNVDDLNSIREAIPQHVTLVAVSKTKPVSDIQEATPWS